jgi:hypothetical protein
LVQFWAMMHYVLPPWTLMCYARNMCDWLTS